MTKRKLKFVLILLFIGLAGYLVPEKIIIPVERASVSDWNPDSFWYEPWGKSAVHKGIDIFGAKGVGLNSSTHGLVLYTGLLNLGGNVVLILGPKWKLHYYAHLDKISIDKFDMVSAGERIGTVGDSGNAKGKPPHLHYSIVTVLPYFWRVDTTTQGWKKMFFLNPGYEIRKL